MTPVKPSERADVSLLAHNLCPRSLVVALQLLVMFILAELSANAAASGVIAWGSAGSWETLVPADLSNVVAVAAGTSTSMALKEDGTVVFWGTTYWGTSSTNFPPGLTNISAIALGYAHALALRRDGHVLAWAGDYDQGRSVVPADVTNACAIAAGNSFSLALRSNGTVAAWGVLSNVPPDLTNVVAIAAGSTHAVALRANGTVAAWRNYNPYNTDVTNVPVWLSNVVAVAAGGEHSLALRADGTVIGWGLNFYGEVSIPPGLSNVTKIDCGEFHSIAIKEDRTVVCWGAGGSGSNSWPNFSQSTVPLGLTNATAIAGGYFHSLAINNGSPALRTLPASQTNYSGTTITFDAMAGGLWPLNYQWQFNGVNLSAATNLPLVLENVQLTNSGSYRLIVSNAFGSVISPEAILVVSNSSPLILQQPVSVARLVGSDYTFSLSVTGSLPISCQWRFNGNAIPAATGTWLNLTNLQLGASGVYDCLLVNNYGAVTSAPAILSVTPSYVVGWGRGDHGETNHPSPLTNVIAISAGSGGLALQSNGIVMAWGAGPSLTNTPPGLTDVIAIAAGEGVNLALTADGLVAAWGGNSFGETAVPPSLTDVVAIAAGTYHAMALRRDGTVAGWGSWESDLVNFGPFTVPAAATNIIAISTGYDHALALRRNGTVLAWGNSVFTRSSTNVPPGLNGVVAIASGSRHCLALKSNGTIVAWGYSTSGATLVPAGLSNVVAIAADSQSVALKADGTVVAWGNNYYGQATVPAGLSNVVAIAAASNFTLALRDLGPLNLIPVRPVKANTVFTAFAPTFNQRTYSLESKDSLTENNWRFITVAAGIGDVATLSDINATVPQRFYRVRQW